MTTRITQLENLVLLLIPYARRYADKRSSYAPAEVNEAIDLALALGLNVPTDPTLEDPMYATDGMFGRWQGKGRFSK
jgi:hypothetical protein